jgi:predicted HicB family RNase H-like nuclease
MEDLGWNDMGHAHAPPIVEQQRAAIEASLGKVVQIVKPSGKQPEHDAGAKAAFTLRINAERHLKLRLACAVTGRSAQQLITEALDQMLESKPIVETLAKQLPARARKQK